MQKKTPHIRSTDVVLQVALLPLHLPLQRSRQGSWANTGPGLVLSELLQKLSCHSLSFVILLRHGVSELMEERSGRSVSPGRMVSVAAEEQMVVVVMDDEKSPKEGNE